MSVTSLFFVILSYIFNYLFISFSKELNIGLCVCLYTYIEQVQLEGQVSLIEYLRPFKNKNNKKKLK